MSYFSKTHQIGVGLIEVMVGLLIGLIAILAAMQMTSDFENRKRVTTGANSGLSNAAIPLFNIQNLVQAAGAGLPHFSRDYHPSSCSNNPTIEVDHDQNAGTANVAVGLETVVITDLGAGQSDQLQILGARQTAATFGQFKGGIPQRVVSIAGSVLTLDSNLGCQNGDIVAIIPPSNGATCTIARVQALGGVNQITVMDANGGIPAVNDAASCLGAWTVRIFSVANNNLLENGVVYSNNVVSIQAQYGIAADVASAAASDVIAAWVDATGAWAVPDTTNRKMIKAVRIAIVSRNPQLEKENVSSACGSGQSGEVCAWDGGGPAIDLTADPDWRRYRYRVFDTIVPVRNLALTRDTHS